MRLKTLRDWLREYETTGAMAALTVEEAEAEQLIKTYLQAFANKVDDYKLRSAELLKLIITLPLQNNSPLIAAIKAGINTDYLLDLFTIIDAQQLITVKSFRVINRMSSTGRHFLYQLFSTKAEQDELVISPAVLDAALFVARHLSCEDSAIDDCFRLLYAHKQLSTSALTVLINHQQDTRSLLAILAILGRQQELNKLTLEQLKTMSSLISLARLLHLLEGMKHIKIDEQLIQKFAASVCQEFICDLIDSLNKSKQCTLSPEQLHLFLQQRTAFFYYKTPLVKLLLQHHILSDALIELVLDDHKEYIRDIMQLMADCSLLEHNEQVVALLFKQDDSYNQSLCLLLNYLQQIGVLEQSVLLAALGRNWQKNDNLSERDVFDLYLLLQQSTLVLSPKQYATVSALSQTDVVRLYRLCQLLQSYNQLNQQSFVLVLAKIDEHLPFVSESTITKNRRKDTGLARSEVTIDKHLSFFVEHNNKKNYAAGSYGTVKKAYVADDSDSPVYAIKKLHITAPARATQEAVREVKYNRLLGRTSFYFWHKGHANVVCEWKNERAMNLFRTEELQAVSYEQRIRCLISGLTDLGTLHAHYRVHNDVKSDNFVLDLAHQTMKLIDFGSAHKRGSAKQFTFTRAYQDVNNPGEGFVQDLYAMGIVVMHLFPELFSVNFESITAFTLIKSRRNLSIQDKAIIHLVHSMMSANASLRCTCYDAINYCSQLIKMDNLDESSLKKLMSSTLKHKDITVTDICCDYLPKM